MVLTEMEQIIIQRWREGKGVIFNCNFGLGTRSYEQEDGRIVIEVDPKPPLTPSAFALKKFMRETIHNWKRALDHEHD